MNFELRPVGLEFLETAPRRFSVVGAVAAPLERVWQRYVDPTTWSEWFPSVREARYRGPGPHGVGSIREATVGRFRFDEVMVVWDEGKRWGYYIRNASFPVARAQLELTEFEDLGQATRLRWTIAADPGVMLRLGSPFFAGAMRRIFEPACRRLSRDLATSQVRPETTR